MSRSIYATLACVVVFFLYACSDKPDTEISKSVTTAKGTQAMRSVQPAKGEAVSTEPWLRTVLPENAFAYVRIPSLWGVIGTPKGTVFDRAVGSQPYADAVKSIRSGVIQTLLPEISNEIEPVWQLLLAHTRSPVEIAALVPAAGNAPMPEVLLSVQLDFDSVEKLNSFLQQAAASEPALEVIKPVGADGRGLLSLLGLPAFTMFDLNSRRLMLLAGSMKPADELDKQLASLKTVADHRMYKLESEIDSSGQGLFAWMDPKSLAAIGESGAAAFGAMIAFGAQEMEAIAFGVGSAGGKQRTMLVFEMPATGMRSLIPLVNTEAKLNAAGELRSVIMFGLPQQDDLKRIEAQFAAMVPLEQMQKYLTAKATMQTEMGFSVEDVLSALGPEAVVLFDGAGNYLAVRLRDARVFDRILGQLQKRLKLKLEEKTIGGRIYQHIAVPGFPDPELSRNLKKERGLERLFMRMLQLPTHVYWTREDGYLVMSGTPQTLIDRYYLKPDISVASWLKQQQKLAPENALFLASGRSRGLPTLMYDMNLQVLLALGDLVDRPVDLFSFPTAREAGLPEYGGVGFKMDSSETRLSMELSYDNNPGEIFFGGGGMGAVAVAGILAAIAIPAYNDYTVRAKVIEGMAATTPQRKAVAEFYMQKQRLPTPKESKDLLGAPESDVISDFAFDHENGVITIGLAIEQFGDANHLYLTPQLVDNKIVWECSANIQRRYLPQSCRK